MAVKEVRPVRGSDGWQSGGTPTSGSRGRPLLGLALHWLPKDNL